MERLHQHDTAQKETKLTVEYSPTIITGTEGALTQKMYTPARITL